MNGSSFLILAWLAFGIAASAVAQTSINVSLIEATDMLAVAPPIE